jgi:release factor glutamine methyltransferase
VSTEQTASAAARLRSAGCVWAEDEAALLAAAAGTAAELDAMVARRAAGEPLEQVVGWAEFCGRRIFVDPGVFVPRRRSEYLVTVAIRLARQRELTTPGPPVIADLCCGTGALGLAAASGLGATSGPGASGLGGPDRIGPPELHAADLDPAAVACARRNVEPAGGHVYAGDLFTALPGSLHGRVTVLICNAPYVPTAEIAFLPAEAREHEAALALDGGTDGLAVLRRLAAGAADWLALDGGVLVETSEHQAPAMAAAMTAGGLLAGVHQDDESGGCVVTGVRAASVGPSR